MHSLIIQYVYYFAPIYWVKSSDADQEYVSIHIIVAFYINSAPTLIWIQYIQFDKAGKPDKGISLYVCDLILPNRPEDRLL